MTTLRNRSSLMDAENRAVESYLCEELSLPEKVIPGVSTVNSIKSALRFAELEYRITR